MVFLGAAFWYSRFSIVERCSNGVGIGGFVGFLQLYGGGGGGGKRFAFGIVSIELSILSSDLDRVNIVAVAIGRGRNGGGGGGASYDEQRLATDGLYSGEYAPDGNWTYVSDRFCVEAYRAIDRYGVLR